MTARVLDGQALAGEIYEVVAARVRERLERGGPRPHLAVVLVGDDEGSAIYVRMKKRNADGVGIASSDHLLPQTATTEDVLAAVRALNADPAVSGILVQMPLPPQCDTAAVIAAIDPVKDVDGLHPLNAGRLAEGLPGTLPCTPAGILELLMRYAVPLEGAQAVVLGRSNLVGKPAALLLLRANATVTVCHSRTRDLLAEVRRSDVVVSAIGSPHLVRAEHVKPGAAVVDVGVSVVEGKVVGDVDPAVAEVAGWLTPNPGGVGPMTRAMLIRNTLEAEEARRPL